MEGVRIGGRKGEKILEREREKRRVAEVSFLVGLAFWLWFQLSLKGVFMEDLKNNLRYLGLLLFHKLIYFLYILEVWLMILGQTKCILFFVN